MNNCDICQKIEKVKRLKVFWFVFPFGSIFLIVILWGLVAFLSSSGIVSNGSLFIKALGLFGPVLLSLLVLFIPFSIILGLRFLVEIFKGGKDTRMEGVGS